MWSILVALAAGLVIGGSLGGFIVALCIAAARAGGPVEAERH